MIPFNKTSLFLRYGSRPNGVESQRRWCVFGE
jgi:hypothetical protein